MKETFAIFFLAVCVLRGEAQQTIFNVPSVDVLDRGKVYVELDSQFKFNAQEAVGRFSNIVPRIVVGRNVELGLNVPGNIQPGADTTTLSPTAKWSFFKSEKKGIALVAGNNFYIPLRNRAYRFGSYTYAEIAKTIRKTRFTAGGYVASKNVFAPHAARGGGQFGFEQTVNKYLNVNADWYTGRHSAGYFTPGIAFKPHPKVSGYLSYSIGNGDAARGNHFFLFEVGYNFN
jgi:hypothetical protein